MQDLTLHAYGRVCLPWWRLNRVRFRLETAAEITNLSSDRFKNGPPAVQPGLSHINMWFEPWSDVTSLRSRVKCESWSEIARSL